MTDRIKLGDMTLRQIGELKCYIANDIRKAIYNIVEQYHRQYDCGDIDLSLDTDIREVMTECGEKFAPSQVNYNVRIKFSKEDE